MTSIISGRAMLLLPWTSAAGAANSAMVSGTSESAYITTSASEMIRFALTVISSGSPGPLPTK